MSRHRVTYRRARVGYWVDDVLVSTLAVDGERVEALVYRTWRLTRRGAQREAHRIRVHIEGVAQRAEDYRRRREEGQP